jgi:hypothetical protein
MRFEPLFDDRLISLDPPPQPLRLDGFLDRALDSRISGIGEPHTPADSRLEWFGGTVPHTELVDVGERLEHAIGRH